METLDQLIIKEILDKCHVDVSFLNTEMNDTKEQFDIIVGELNAGNNNPKIKEKIKKVNLNGIQRKQINIKQVIKVLQKLQQV